MNANIKTAIVYGFVTLISAFIGVWGGREVVALEMRILHESVKANTEAIAKNTDQISSLALQMAQLSIVQAKQEDRIKIIELWRVDISNLAASRGFELPDIRRRLEILERRK